MTDNYDANNDWNLPVELQPIALEDTIYVPIQNLLGWARSEQLATEHRLELLRCGFDVDEPFGVTHHAFNFPINAELLSLA